MSTSKMTFHLDIKPQMRGRGRGRRRERGRCLL